jgi:hypothetical protein
MSIKGAKPKSVKPNGKEMGVFVISISDGYAKYSYDFNLNTRNSINSVLSRIRKAFPRSKVTNERIRKP